MNRSIRAPIAMASDLPCVHARRMPMASAERVPGDEGSERRPRRSVFVDDAAELLGVSRRTVYNRIREGRLRTIRTRCGSRRVLLESVEALLGEQLARQSPRRWRLR